MEEELRNQQPKLPKMTLRESLQLSLQLLEENEQSQLAYMIGESNKNIQLLLATEKYYNMTEVAKDCTIKSARDLNTFLSYKKVQYKHNNTWVTYPEYDNSGYFIVNKFTHRDGTIGYDRKITQLGKDFIIKLVESEV